MAQKISIQYFDSVDAIEVNTRFIDIRKRGIYKGGYLTKVSDVQVSLSAFVCEIGDNDYQVRIEDIAATAIAVDTTNKYVVIRWGYVASSSNEASILGVAVGDLLANDLIVGACQFSGSTLTGFDYTLRTSPNVLDLFLKVEPLATPSMYVRIRAGRVTYGNAIFDVIDQTILLTAPGSNSRIDLIQVNTSGAMIVTQGTAAVTPVAPSYSNLVTLAQITLTTGQTTITETSIKDVRSPFVSANRIDTDNTFAADSDVRVPSQKAVKTYVDARSGVLGTRATRSVNIIYQAATDGFLKMVLIGTNGTDTHAEAKCWIGTSTPPTETDANVRGSLSTGRVSNFSGYINYAGDLVPIKKNEYYIIKEAGQIYLSTYEWIPLGN